MESQSSGWQEAAKKRRRIRVELLPVLIALAVSAAPAWAGGATVQLRLVLSTPSGVMDARLGDVASALKSRGFGGGNLLGDRSVAVAPGRPASVSLPEGTTVEVSNENESPGRTTLRIQVRGWGGTVVLKDHPTNKPALIVGPERRGGRLVLAVRLR